MSLEETKLFVPRMSHLQNTNSFTYQRKLSPNKEDFLKLITPITDRSIIIARDDKKTIDISLLKRWDPIRVKGARRRNRTPILEILCIGKHAFLEDRVVNGFRDPHFENALLGESYVDAADSQELGSDVVAQSLFLILGD